jgi:hypothetical protein
MSVINDILHGIGTGPSLRDFQHANKIFVANGYELMPKYSFLFHVSFDINSNLSRLTNLEKIQTGLLVKSVQLPKYTIDTKTMNAYNRVNIVQNKLKYDPITITFHDDSADVIRDFWYNYMSYYYRDTDYQPTTYTQPSKYNAQQTDHWGYQPAKYDTFGNTERLLNAIKVYSLHQKRFTEYVLVNPTITSFQHGQHQQGQSEFLENTMTVAFETVLYNYGTVLYDGEPDGFATLNYDKTPSPLTPAGGGTSSLLGPGGLLSAAQGISQSMASSTIPVINPDGSTGTATNYLGIAQTGLQGLRAFNNIKGQNLLGLAGAELKTIGKGILSGDTNTLNRLSLPAPGPSKGSNSVIQSAE